MAYVEENILSDEDEVDWSAPLVAGPEDAVQGYETSSTQSSGVCTKKGSGYSDSNRQNLTSTYKGMSSHSTREGQENKGLVSRMQLNDYKAGMQGLDRERINKIIYEASKGSRFYENEMKKEAQMAARVEEMQRRLTLLTSEQMQAGEQEADQILQTLEAGRDMSRTIVHVDMDMFYAAVEMKDDPALQHVPMAVGSNSMLSTSNYIARRFGVRAAMPGFIGRKLCPDLVIVPTNFEKYTAVSKQIRAVMADYDPNFSPMSLDEAFLDMTSHLEKRAAFGEDERTFQTMLTLEELCRCDTVGAPSVDSGSGVVAVSGDSGDSGDPIKDRGEGAASTNMADKQTTCNVCGKQRCAAQGKVETFGMSAEEAVREMRARIHWETKLTASAGIAPNTMLAKVCSDQNKPNGQYYMPSSREAVLDFVSKLDIRKVSGIGKVATQLLRSVGVDTCSDLFTRRGVLRHLYSEVSFNYFLRISAGIGSTRVERDGERKSMSVERTFSEIREPKELYQKCHELCESLAEDLSDEQIVGKMVGIKLKTVNFRLMTRAQTLLNATCDTQQIYGAARELLRTEILHCQPDPLRLRLMGVRMSNLMPKNLVGEQKQCTITSLLLKMKSNPPRVQTTSVAPPILESTSVGPPSLEACTVALSNPVLTSVGLPRLDFDSVAPPSPKSTSVAPPSPLPHPDEISSISSCTFNSHATQIPISKDRGSKSQGTALWKRTGNLPNKKKSFVCPICSEDIAVSNLNQFNRHIDECLVRNPKDLATLSDDVTERVDTISKLDQPRRTPPDIKSVSKSTEPELMSLKIEDKEQSETKVKSVSRVDMPSHEEQKVKSQTNNTIVQLKVKIDDSETRYSLEASQINHQKHCEKTGIDDVIETPGGSKLDVTSAVQPILDALFCPICNRHQDTSDLTVFNKHVDECLNQGLLLSDDQCFKSASKTSAALKRTPKASGRTKKRTPMASRVKRSATKAAECGGPSNAGVTSSESSCRTPGEKNENLVMTCPVCDLSQEWTSQDAFSRHVDSCLNRAAIRDLLHGDTSTQNKRPSTHLPDEPTSKRKKCLAKGVQRIDSFFNN